MKRHVFLKNTKSSNPKFNRKRNIKGGKDNRYQEEAIETEQTEPKIIQEFQKENLRKFNIKFYSKRKIRSEKKIINFSEQIDYIRIMFYNVFNFDLKEKFILKYGLLPVEYSDFNKTVLFEIFDSNLFKNFRKHIEIVINSKIGTSYYNKEYNLIALIFKFEFVDSDYRVNTYSRNGILLDFISSINPTSDIQKSELFKYLKNNEIKYSYFENYDEILEIENINIEQIKFIADNFDIIKSITSSRIQKLRPGYNGPVRDFEFGLIVKNTVTKVGIIDTGVEKLSVFKEVLLNDFIDITGNGAFWDEVGHGTMVAGLVTLGDEFYNDIKNSYDAKAKIFIVKVLQQDNDSLKIPELLDSIKYAKKKFGIRIFNLSLVVPKAKKYNENFSSFAYELDKIAFEEDILIFISVGNFNSDSLKSLIYEEPHPDHEYPDFFYKPNSTSTDHTCEDTNICIPSESLNNISVGALAGNLEDIDSSDATPNEVYPAFYTRKFHYDFSKIINTQPIKLKNKHLNKPDFVFWGGDLFDESSGLEVLRSPLNIGDKYYGRSCGTSLATPLITSYASEILNEYPNLKTQTIKALLINSANFFTNKQLPHFKEKPETLLKSLTGFGMPKKDGLIENDKNCITFIIEETIKIGEIIKIPINLPSYLKKTGNKLQFDISLCYSFMPIKNNQLDYLPLHISFNLIKNIDNIKLFETGNQSDYSIKNNITWSEDHFGIDNRLFSNSQFMSYRLQPADFERIDDSIAIAIRCLSKNDYTKQYSKKSNNFSLIIKITEILLNESDGNLYNEMLEINNYIDISNSLDLELEAEN